MTRPLPWPTEPDSITIEVLSSRKWNNERARSFCMYWLTAEGKRRAQMFRANPIPYARRALQQGQKVRIIRAY